MYCQPPGPRPELPGLFRKSAERADNLDLSASPIVAVEDVFVVERYCSISLRSICFAAAR